MSSRRAESTTRYPNRSSGLINIAIRFATHLSEREELILDLLYRSLHRWGRVLNLTGATTDWLDTKEQGERLLEQATLLEPSFHPVAQDELRHWIADETRTLRAVYG